MNCVRLLRTLVHLKFSQLWFQVWRRIQRKVGPHPPCGTEMLPSFSFLNLTASPRGWNDPSLDMLWRYNLHYFDALGRGEEKEEGRRKEEEEGEREKEEGRRKREEEGEKEEGRRKKEEGEEERKREKEEGRRKEEEEEALVERWMRENPRGSVPGWDPYPTSLRVVNWIKWRRRKEEGRRKKEEGKSKKKEGRRKREEGIRESVREQLDWLEGHLEWHILANHLLANLKALVIGRTWLGEDASAWVRLYRRQIAEQVLSDGGHYERSVMYHAIILEDVLDVMRFCGACADDLKPIAVRMLRYLVRMTGPDGKIVLFNDAADGIARPTAWLVASARRLGVTLEGDAAGPVTDFPETGFARLEAGEFVLFVDIAPLGPDYQPGHAHADTLTYELYYKGEKVVTDVGTSEYRGARRAFERSTAAHNVVQVDGRDTSEVWSSHRVGRRARIVERTITGPTDAGVIRVRGAIVANGCRIARTWTLSPSGLEVEEQVEGGTSCVTRLHLTPGARTRVRVDLPGARSETYERALEFGKMEGAECLVAGFDPGTVFRYTIAPTSDHQKHHENPLL